LLHPDEAFRLILAAAKEIPLSPLETVPLMEARGRVLPHQLPCLLDQPPFDKSKMDGFAYRPGERGEAGSTYRVVRTIAAGTADPGSLEEGEAARIMTGAPIPRGAQGVQRVEFTDEQGDLVRFTRVDPDLNIISRGQHMREGDPLLSPRVLEATDIGILAANGYGKVEVSARPTVAVLSTGSELKTAGATLEPGQIFDSNRPMLLNLVAEVGAIGIDGGLVTDQREETERAIEGALESADILIITGGVSMGDFDYVPGACEKLGVQRLFHKVALKPGKPAFCGRRGDKLVFALPGNPLSAFLGFSLFVRPVLSIRSGISYTPKYRRCRLTEAIQRRATERVEYQPAHIEGSDCTPLPCNGSSMLTILGQTRDFAVLDIGKERAEAGEWIHVRQFR